MSESNSRSFEAILKGLEDRRAIFTEKRRSFTKNLVTQTNEESKSGMPYVVDVSGLIAKANGAELFLDDLINSLRSDSRTLGEGGAVKRALGSVFEQVKHLEVGDRSGYVGASELYEIGRTLVDWITSVELRSADI